MPRIGLLDPVEQVFEQMQAADEAGRGEAGDHAENGVEKQQQRGAEIALLERRQRHDEGRLVDRRTSGR